MLCATVIYGQVYGYFPQNVRFCTLSNISYDVIMFCNLL